MASLVEKGVMNSVLLVGRESTLGRFSSNRRLGVAGQAARLSSLRGGCPRPFAPGRRVQAGRSCHIFAALDAGEDSTPIEKQPSYLSSTPGYLNVQESNFFKPPPSNKGWDDPRMIAQLRCLAVIVHDRAEMHGAVAIQRDNWGKLIQVTVTMSLISAGILAALNTRAPLTSFSLSLTSALLSGGAIIFMCLQNWFQPSQLAEEQRAATRYFKNLVKEIEASLKPGGSTLRQEAKSFYEAKIAKLKSLDIAFPLPLFPGGIDKFPEEVGPAVLSDLVDTSTPEVHPISEDLDNGWSAELVADLKRTSALLKKSEIATYVSWEKNASKINKFLAISGPIFALMSMVANFVGGSTGALVATGCCVLAALLSSFSHDAQVGMVYEMYREVAGTFEDLDKDIQRNLRLPVEQREDGEIFHQKVALQLGRIEGKAIVKDDDQKNAGTLL